MKCQFSRCDKAATTRFGMQKYCNWHAKLKEYFAGQPERRFNPEAEYDETRKRFPEGV